ncbi:hypothetical protein J6Y50_08130 [bacterium]|nr:hypothetical protein [bacterium]
MKKILFAVFMVLAAVFAVSCSGEDEIASAVGGSCSVEGAETCSADGAQILICQSLSWQTKKSCNLNFGQYCRQTASGSYSCTDSGSSSDPADSGNDNSDTSSEDLPDTSDTDTDTDEPDTATEETDNEPNEEDTETDEDTDTEENDDDTDSEPEDNTPIETCAGIVECQAQCDSQNCSSNCYARGSAVAQNEFYESHQLCNTYTEIDDLKRCQELAVKCGLKGDESYGIPYGHAVINGSFAHIHEAGTSNFTTGTFIDAFVNGTFGSNGNIPDPTSNASFAFARLFDEHTLALVQTYDSTQETGKTPVVIFEISVTAPGTYSVGWGKKDKIAMYVGESASGEECFHAFGYGFVEISGTGLAETYTAGANTINIQGEVELYSHKNAPMYNGDITTEQLAACSPK